MDKNISGVWHLQDDVIISRDFRYITERYDDGIVCGFTCAYDTAPECGIFKLCEHKMWFSFPCIRIPTRILIDFAEWANCNLWQSNYFKLQVIRNNSDDLIFREWLYDNYPDLYELNLAPNVVNHIDKYLEGSQANKQRDAEQDTMSIFWEDNGELSTLLKALDNRKNI